MEIHEKYKNILAEIAPDLEQFKQEACAKIVQTIQDRADRDEAVSLTRKVFNIKLHQEDPESYKKGLARLTEILSKYGSSI